MRKKWLSALGGGNELLLVGSMIGILVVLFAPVPAAVLDFLLLLNFSAALMILLVTFYTEKPLAFSTFPSLLLMTTLFRLSLNISATRLILGHAHAGKVIESVGTHVVGGNYVIGLVVFLILIVVQYVVLTNGAQRVAEVAARFTLDSLPGKQMSIDADLNMGMIDQDEAKRRRAQLERESNFYGAMDGASKFVKGDAIAGIVIIVINIVGGLSIGILQLGMGWQEALHRYTLLTVGDGIVTQIPSLVIAVATGIIITRAATDARLGEEVSQQFSAHPRAMLVVAVALAGIGILPGVPLLPVVLLIVALLATAWLASKRAKQEVSDQAEGGLPDAAKEGVDGRGDALESFVRQPFELIMGRGLFASYGSGGFIARLGQLRAQLAREIGAVLPPIAAREDHQLPDSSYQVQVFGVTVGHGDIDVDCLLALNPGGERAKIEGRSTREPTYGLVAQWISKETVSKAKLAGYTLVEPDTVLITHVQELSKRSAPDFLTRAETERMLELRRKAMGSLLDDLVPAVLSYSDVQRVLQGLLREHVAIHNLEAIMEVLVDAGRYTKSVDDLIERVREKLGAQICEKLKDVDGELHAITLDPELERSLIGSRQREAGTMLSPTDMDKLISRLAGECENQLRQARAPVLLCAPSLRRSMRQLLQRAIPQLNVISINEISYHARTVSAAVISIDSSAVMEAT